MNQFKHWIISFLLLQVVAFAMIVYLAYAQAWVVFAIFLTMTLLTDVIFFGFLISIRRKGIQRDLDISRVLGKDAKDALEFGEIGIITYDDEYICTWTSD